MNHPNLSLALPFQALFIFKASMKKTSVLNFCNLLDSVWGSCLQQMAGSNASRSHTVSSLSSFPPWLWQHSFRWQTMGSNSTGSLCLLTKKEKRFFFSFFFQRLSYQNWMILEKKKLLWRTNNPDCRAVREAQKCHIRPKHQNDLRKQINEHKECSSVARPVTLGSQPMSPVGPAFRVLLGSDSLWRMDTGPGGVSLWILPRRKPTNRTKENASYSSP